MGPHKIIRLLFLASVMAFPLTAAAQDKQPATTVAPGKPQTEQQKRGEALFTNHCPLCHIFTKQKRSLKVQASGELVGLFKDSTTTEEGVRQLILTGIPRSMPSFKYALEPSELDDLIAYLKIR